MLRADATSAAPLVDTRDYYLAAGEQQVILTVSVDRPDAPFAAVSLLDAATNQVISSSAATAASGGWRDVAVTLALPERGRRARIRVTSTGHTPFSLAQVALPVDYAFSAVDLTAALNTFNTHTSIFDAHPNERAHKLIAEKVLEGLQKTRSHR
jgi:hypothetical protein